ncbi:RBP11-like subunits of RNA polymerase [Tilletiopsis washingtonensis]|uniref:DNA-directed RNA polymerases I and III subunit RPAC2 n=1 Tax=Tilletiopsis washingtonensis TaxID=58919 RepID=A0A316ZI01_9BASI|nr:RBP11-like subunits of RNA polymerase [Tilletiopsis washingtonensis]PWO00897.1 RBP11-like subunits of RNA polymerase [Tilletiopsis washingtonensis]
MAEVPGVGAEQAAVADPPAPMEIDEGPKLSDKISILPGHEKDLSAATFCLKDEDHTLGNALRYMLMKNPKVEFCGYSNPHPSEPKIHLRVQMYDHLSALSALLDAIKNLEALFVTIEDAYTANLSEGNYERHSDEVSPEALRAMEERGRAIQAEKKAQAAARP